jgi:drug/metabolite transporter (DMT)-like permease
MVRLTVFLLVALVIEAVGVVWLSHGLKQIGEIRQFNAEEIGRFLGRGLSNPHILLGTALETTFFLMLLVLLKRHDVSLIWPLTSLGFVLTALAAKFIRHEEVSALRWGGVVLIVIGAGLVGWSERNKKAAASDPAALAAATPVPPDAIEPRGGASR